MVGGSGVGEKRAKGKGRTEIEGGGVGGRKSIGEWRQWRASSSTQEEVGHRRERRHCVSVACGRDVEEGICGRATRRG